MHKCDYCGKQNINCMSASFSADPLHTFAFCPEVTGQLGCQGKALLEWKQLRKTQTNG